MKRMIAFFVLGCCVSNISAMNIYNTISSGVVNCGALIEKVDLPLVGKLTNVLPVGVVATSCKEYPGQTMVLCAGLLCYILSNNEKIAALFNTYKDNALAALGINRKYNVTSDDTLFIFDGDDADDAQEQMDMEDELLADDDSSDIKRNKQIKFL